MGRYGLNDPSLDVRRYGQNGLNGEAWVWGFLRVALSTLVGFDEANGIVEIVQLSAE